MATAVQIHTHRFTFCIISILLQVLVCKSATANQSGKQLFLIARYAIRTPLLEYHIKIEMPFLNETWAILFSL
jgi:hypothetical protein